MEGRKAESRKERRAVEGEGREMEGRSRGREGWKGDRAEKEGPQSRVKMERN